MPTNRWAAGRADHRDNGQEDVMGLEDWVVVVFGVCVVAILAFFLSSPPRSPWQRRPCCPVCGRLGALVLQGNLDEDEPPSIHGRRLRIYRCRRCRALAVTRVLDPEDV
jgi:hypothetical protein